MIPPGGPPPPAGRGEVSGPRSREARRVARWAAEFLSEHGVPGARLDAEVILAHCLEIPRYRLYSEPGRLLDETEFSRVRELVERRGGREPLQYILGRQEFWSLDFRVDRRVLIPRPETEVVLEEALKRLGDRSAAPLLIDMGSGCGNMAVILARELPGAMVIALDVSPGAAACTRENALRHGVGARIITVCADMFGALGGSVRADAILSNPPYIETRAVAGLQPEVSRHEPRGALDGGEDGLEVVGGLLRSSPDHLKGGGYLIFEAGEGQAEAVKAAAAKGAWLSHETVDDYSGKPRVHVLRKK